MKTFTIKSETSDPKRAVEIVRDLRNKGFTAWIEDENGETVDEQVLQSGDFKPSRPSLRERVEGLLVFVGAAVIGLGTLYLVGLWVDH